MRDVHPGCRCCVFDRFWDMRGVHPESAAGPKDEIGLLKERRNRAAAERKTEEKKDEIGLLPQEQEFFKSKRREKRLRDKAEAAAGPKPKAVGGGKVSLSGTRKNRPRKTSMLGSLSPIGSV